MKQILKVASYYQSKLAEEQQAQKTPYYQQEMNQIQPWVAEVLKSFYNGNVPIYETSVKPALSPNNGKLWVQVIVKINEPWTSKNLGALQNQLKANQNRFPNLILEPYVQAYREGE